MKRQLVFGTVMAAALTVGLGAQSTTPQYPSPTSTPSTSAPSSPSQDPSQDRAGKRSDRGQMVTVTGCLQSSDTAVGAATGTTGAAAGAAGASSAGFQLTDVMQSSTDKSGATATGTAGTTAMASIPSKVQLTASGNSSANWSRYLNHKVEVKGTLENTAGNAPSATPSANEPSRPGAGAMGSTDMAKLHVTSIKEVSGTCSGSSIK